MISKEITESEITDYLLGVLDGARSEMIEERTFTDVDFADRVNAVEHDLLDAYVAGDLGQVERSRFESHYSASPLRLEKIRFAETFRTFADLPQARASPAGDSDTSIARSGWWPANFGWRPVLPFSFAALTIAAATTVWWLYSGSGVEIVSDPKPSVPIQSTISPLPALSDPVPEPDRSPGPGSEIAGRDNEPRSNEQAPAKRDRAGETKRGRDPAPRVFSFILAPPVRGSQLRSISVPADAERVSVGIELESAGLPAYRVALYEQSGDREIWRSGTIRPGSQNKTPSLNVSLPARLLKPQIYRFTVTGISPDASIEIIGDYAFKVVR